MHELDYKYNCVLNRVRSISEGTYRVYREVPIVSIVRMQRMEERAKFIRMENARLQVAQRFEESLRNRMPTGHYQHIA